MQSDESLHAFVHRGLDAMGGEQPLRRMEGSEVNTGHRLAVEVLLRQKLARCPLASSLVELSLRQQQASVVNSRGKRHGWAGGR